MLLYSCFYIFHFKILFTLRTTRRKNSLFLEHIFLLECPLIINFIPEIFSNYNWNFDSIFSYQFSHILIGLPVPFLDKNRLYTSQFMKKNSCNIFLVLNPCKIFHASCISTFLIRSPAIEKY